MHSQKRLSVGQARKQNRISACARQGICVAAIVVIGLLGLTASASSGELVGLAGGSGGGLGGALGIFFSGTVFANVDPSIQPLPPPSPLAPTGSNFYSATALAFDPDAGLLYMERQQSDGVHLVSIDTTTGVFNDLGLLTVVFKNFVFNPDTRKLVGLAGGPGGGTFGALGITFSGTEFASVDPNAGVNPLPVLSLPSSTAGGTFIATATTFDPDTRLLYMQKIETDGAHLVAIDTTTGTLTDVGFLPTPFRNFVFDPDTRKLVGLAGGGGGGIGGDLGIFFSGTFFASLDPSIQPLSPPSTLAPAGSNFYSATATALDPDTSLFYMERQQSDGVHLISFGTTTGTLTDIGLLSTPFRNFVFVRPHPTLVDPIPLVPGDPSLIAGPAITTDIARLASANGRKVSGVATDGVAQLVIRIPARSVDEQFLLSFAPTQNDPTQCLSPTPTDCGVLFDPLHPPSNLLDNPTATSPVVTAIMTPNGPVAFAAYRAPTDFVRSATAKVDADLLQRSVLVSITSLQNGDLDDLQINLVRPPVILVHGNWSGPAAWNSFKPISNNTDLRFMAYRADYSPSQELGVLADVDFLLGQFTDFSRDFRRDKKIASVQADLIAYSLGGLVSRAASQDPRFYRNFPFGRGPVHKMITLDTPHLGSEFASKLSTSSSKCQNAFTDHGKIVGKNISDMAIGSSLLSNLSTKSTAIHLPTHAVVGIASTTQMQVAEDAFFKTSFNKSFWLHTLYCPDLLPQGGFSELLSPVNDLVVSDRSQRASGLGINGSVPNSVVLGVIHVVDTSFFPQGPDVLGEDVVNDQVGDAIVGPQNVITNHVIDLLNTPVNTSSYGPILP